MNEQTNTLSGTHLKAGGIQIRERKPLQSLRIRLSTERRHAYKGIVIGEHRKTNKLKKNKIITLLRRAGAFYGRVKGIGGEEAIKTSNRSKTEGIDQQ